MSFPFQIFPICPLGKSLFAFVASRKPSKVARGADCPRSQDQFLFLQVPPQLIIPCHSFEGKSITEKIPAAGTQDSLPDTRGGVVALQIPAQAHSWAAVMDISRPCHLWGCTEKLQTEK